MNKIWRAFVKLHTVFEWNENAEQFMCNENNSLQIGYFAQLEDLIGWMMRFVEECGYDWKFDPHFSGDAYRCWIGIYGKDTTLHHEGYGKTKIKAFGAAFDKFLK